MVAVYVHNNTAVQWSLFTPYDRSSARRIDVVDSVTTTVLFVLRLMVEPRVLELVGTAKPIMQRGKVVRDGLRTLSGWKEKGCSIKTRKGWE